MRSASRKTIMFGIVATLGLFSASAFAVDHPVQVGVVVNGGFTFSPSTLNIAAGDTVTWTSAGGSAPHNVRSDAGSVTNFRCANGCDGAGGSGRPCQAPPHGPRRSHFPQQGRFRSTAKSTAKTSDV